MKLVRLSTRLSRAVVAAVRRKSRLRFLHLDHRGITGGFRKFIAGVHDGHTYYRQAEDWLDSFWSPGSPFTEMFAKLNLENSIELACGHGRHTAQIIEQAGCVTLVDVNKSNIDACRTRFAGRSNVKYYTNSGFDLKKLRNREYTSLFTYDAMVHFEALDVIAYLHEIERVLRVGGRALLHYSNYEGAPGGAFNESIHWRNFFSEPMMKHFASRAGLRVLESRIIDWPPGPGGVKNLDGLVLLEKPAYYMYNPNIPQESPQRLIPFLPA